MCRSTISIFTWEVSWLLRSLRPVQSLVAPNILLCLEKTKICLILLTLKDMCYVVPGNPKTSCSSANRMTENNLHFYIILVFLFGNICVFVDSWESMATSREVIVNLHNHMNTVCLRIHPSSFFFFYWNGTWLIE